MDDIHMMLLYFEWAGWWFLATIVWLGAWLGLRAIRKLIEEQLNEKL